VLILKSSKFYSRNSLALVQIKVKYQKGLASMLYQALEIGVVLTALSRILTNGESSQ
jgi:hypothetical protein